MWMRMLTVRQEQDDLEAQFQNYLNQTNFKLHQVKNSQSCWYLQNSVTTTVCRRIVFVTLTFFGLVGLDDVAPALGHDGNCSVIQSDVNVSEKLPMFDQTWSHIFICDGCLGEILKTYNKKTKVLSRVWSLGNTLSNGPPTEKRRFPSQNTIRF